MKLFYSPLIAVLLFFLALPPTSPRSLEKRIRSLEANVSNLKHEVDDLLAYFKTCNSTVNETVFSGFVSNYLHNKSLVESHSRSNDTEDVGMLQKLKQKIKKLLNFSKNPSYDESFRLSRSSDGNGDDGGGCASLKQHVMKLVNCLDVEDKVEVNETVVEEEEFSHETTTQLSQKELEEAAEKSKVDTALSFMGHLKHPVETIGRPTFKRPDLNKIQEQIENAKSAAWMQVDEMETTTEKRTSFKVTENPLDFFEMPNIVVIKRRNCEDSKKSKRSDLFKGLLDPAKDAQLYEVPTGQQADDEQTMISNEVNKLATKIDLRQQMELISFNDQLGEKPKRFDFDVEPFYQQALANITSLKNQQQESEKADDDVILGPNKFFTFDADKRKRSNKEKLKQNLVSEFEDHSHFSAENFEKRVKKVHDDHVDRSDYRFLEENYRLNDGSTHADEIIKPLNVVGKLKTPNEIKMEMELGERLKELESYESDAKETQRAPFFKTENVAENETDLEELSP